MTLEDQYPELDWDNLDADEVYEAVHWGELPDDVFMVEDDRHEGEQLVMLGEVTELTYLATKGGGPPTEYVHEFHDPLPLLCIDEQGRLDLVGGAYWVAPHGIVG